MDDASSYGFDNKKRPSWWAFAAGRGPERSARRPTVGPKSRLRSKIGSEQLRNA